VELIEAATENVLWKTDYNRPLNSIVAMQTDIAHDVSARLKSRLSGVDEREVSKTYTENPQAYQLYLKGLYQWNKRTPDSLKQALALFQQAIEQDPGYAKAHVGLALTYIVLDDNTSMNPQEIVEAHLKAKAAATKALEFDESLAEPHAVMASVKGYDWDFAGAEAEFKRAIELNPKIPSGQAWYGRILMRLGDTEKAKIAFKMELASNANDFDANLYIGILLRQEKQLDEALSYLVRATRLRPREQYARYHLAAVYAAAGKPSDALPLLEGVLKEHTDFVEARVLLASVYYRLNRKEDGDREKALIQKSNADQQSKSPEQR